MSGQTEWIALFFGDDLARMFSEAEKDLHHMWFNVCILFSADDAVDLGLDEKLADSEVTIHSRALDWWI